MKRSSSCLACYFYGNLMSSDKVLLAIPGCELAPISAYSPINALQENMEITDEISDGNSVGNF
ncbi:hypothetical protein F2Q68_00043328 [Brassica cretica]|uniref:Uncharacterized protein n=1 Tax=Brassica cretica TaxID=69181 RepID=A0A8S9LRF1_BRACR|nr:hypothetical protein F2Q68_00043328 [Brassica cretica]